MSSRAYYGIQFIQSRYLLMWESGMFDTMVEETFSRSEDIAVNYQGFAHGASGRAEVRRFFEDVGELAQINGSIIRNDLPTSQYICVDEDGCAATGKWITMSAVIEGPAYGNMEPPYPYPYYIGIFENRYIKENGEWRIKTLNWKPLLELGDWTMNPKTCIGLYYSDPEKWPRPFEKHSFDFDEPTAVDNANIDVRTLCFRFAHEFAAKGKRAVNEEFFTEQGMADALAMLPEEKNGFYGALLLTSPIVRISETLDSAEIFLSTGVLTPNGDSVIHSKGRICAKATACSGNWKIAEWKWYSYASLEPWPVKAIHMEVFA